MSAESLTKQSMVFLLLVAASVERTHPIRIYMIDPQLIICKKKFSYVLQTSCQGEHDYFYWSKKTFFITE